MKILTMIAILTSLITLFATDITYEFENYIASESNDSYIDVIAVFEKPPDYRDRFDELMQNSATNREIIAFLKEESSDLAGNFRDSYYENIKSGQIRDIRTMWLNASIKMAVQRSLLVEMIEKNEFASILHNRPYQMIEESHQAEESLWDVRWNISLIGCEDVYELGFMGGGVLVGVFDTGIRYTHQDLENRMWTNPGEIEGNGIDDDGNGYVDDYYGYDFVNSVGDPMDDNDWTWHGTHCAGTVCGDGSYDTQTGVAPEASVMALKVLDSGGSGIPADVEEGMEYAADMGVQIFSLSIGWEEPSTTLSNYFREIFENLLAMDIVAAVSAGNGSGGGGHYTPPLDISAPANCPSPWYGTAGHSAVIAVGATDSDDNIASFSSYGHVEWTETPYDDYSYLIKPDICAPGVSITSTWGYTDVSYNSSSGTSMAAPHIAGAMALLLSKAPYLSPRQLDSLLCATALDLGTSGRDNYYGAGRVQIHDAITAAPAPPYPIINYISKLIDDTSGGDGNNILDRGESPNLLVTIKNSGAEVTGLNATIFISDPNVTVIDNSANYGDIGTNEEVINIADPFVISCAPDAPLGHSFDVIISYSGDVGSYSGVDTFQVSISNYPRQHQTLTYGSGIFTITNFGSYGFFDPTASSPLGDGFVFWSENYLYSSYFFLGLPGENVITGENGTESEFLPIGEIQDTPILYGDHELYVSFVDPVTSLIFDFRAIGWDSEPNDNFVILRYQVINPTDSSITYYPGLYTDWDLHYVSGDGWYDRAAYNPTERWCYMWDNHSTPDLPNYVGIVGVTEMAGGSIVNNAEYVYPSGLGWTDDVKFDFLDGSLSFSTASADSDWSLIMTAGSKTIEPYGLDTIAWAIVGGYDLSDFETNAIQARSMITVVLGQNEQAAKPDRREMVCYPNPFNSAISIRKRAKAHIRITDLEGRVIYHDSSKRDNIIFKPKREISSGVYIVRSGNESERILYIK
ncbi:MAG: S8 family serine peptidase [Candidatus Zixiibacteriota bacterium]